MKYTMLSAASAENTPFLQRMAEKYHDIYIKGIVSYENLNMSADDFKMITILILGLSVGIIIASFVSVFNKRVLGDFVRAVIDNEATSSESAKTLEELGFEDSFIMKMAVARSVSLRRVVKCREEEDFYAELNQKKAEYQEKRAKDKSLPKFKDIEYKVKPLEDKFFVPEDMKYTAQIKFEKKGTNLRSAIGVTILTVIAFIVIILALPALLEFLNGLSVNA